MDSDRLVGSKIDTGWLLIDLERLEVVAKIFLAGTCTVCTGFSMAPVLLAAPIFSPTFLVIPLHRPAKRVGGEVLRTLYGGRRYLGVD